MSDASDTSGPVIDTPVATPAVKTAADLRPKEGFNATMDRIAKANGFTDDAPSEEPEVPTGEEPTKPDHPKPKAPPKPTEPDPEADTDGDGKVSATERVEFRKAKARFREHIEAQNRELDRRINEARSAFNGELSQARQILEAFKSRDGETLAQLAGLENFGKLNEEFIAKYSDPSYQEIRALKQAQRERDEREAKARAQWEEQQRFQQRQAAVVEYKQRLSAQMKESKDPVVRALHDLPQFVGHIYQILEENYDSTTNSTVTVEQALKLGARNSNRAFLEDLKILREKLNLAFGSSSEPSEKKPNGKVPPKRVNGAPPKAEAAPNGQRSKKDFGSYFQARMAQAVKEDRDRESS